MKVLITIPVYNEEKILKKNIIKLNNFLKHNFNYDYVIEIVDNKSTDSTRKISLDLVEKYKEVKLLRVDRKGKGFAIKKSWELADSTIDVLSFMDIDLATNLKYFQKLIDAIVVDGFDISIGSRYNKNSKIKRNLYRLFISKIYIYIQKLLFNIEYNDSQCGFKAIDRKKYQKIQKDIKDNFFFFDTELLLVAVKKYKYSVKSIPVEWEEGVDSKVNSFKVGIEFIKNIFRMFWYLKRVK